MEEISSFEKNVATTKEKVIELVRNEEKALLKDAETDMKIPAFYYHARVSTLNKFVEQLEWRDFPVMSEPWGYTYWFDGTAYEFLLAEFEERNSYKIDKRGSQYGVTHYYTLVRVEAEYISVEEYAERAGVDPKTVMQQIRRSKIRSAKKMGGPWMIPAVMTVQPRNYMPARYIIKGDVRPLSDKFDFLPREGEVMIMRNLDGNKFLDDYIVSCRGYYGKDTEKSGRMEVLSQADREKLELGLIAHPNVKYLADYREIPESNPYL